MTKARTAMRALFFYCKLCHSHKLAAIMPKPIKQNSSRTTSTPLNLRSAASCFAILLSRLDIG